MSVAHKLLGVDGVSKQALVDDAKPIPSMNHVHWNVIVASLPL